MAKKKKKKSSMARKVMVSLLFVVFLGVLLTGWHYYSLIFVKGNVNVQNPDNVYFYVHSGWNYEQVRQSLIDKNLLDNPASFDWVAELKKYKYNVKAGRFLLKPGMTNNELINLLRLSGNQTPVQVTIHNARSIEELAGRVSDKIEADSAALVNYIKQPEVYGKIGFSKEHLLALFIPNTYEFFWNTSAEEFLERMHHEYQNFWTASRQAKAKEIGLSAFEVATLASIVQAETRQPDEMPKVAGLYLNRLKRNMFLQADPTVKFAVGDPTLRRIYYKHLRVDSPYNTYKNKGLPPGPINMPSITAIDAVLNYIDHNYIFMCARPDYSGYHNFAASHGQHLVNKRKYTRFLREEGIY